MMQELRAGSSPDAMAAALLTSNTGQFVVLQIDDGLDDRFLFQAACERCNAPFIWHVKETATEAISHLKRLVELGGNKSAHWPDLVLLDVVMPVTSGFEVLKFIRATPGLNRLPVVVYTGDERLETECESIRLGANLFLNKPYRFGKIVSIAGKLHEMLKRIRTGGFFPTALPDAGRNTFPD